MAFTVEPSLIWHRRLGHLSYRKLQQTLLWISVSPFDCESCELGKYHRATFRSLRLVRSKSPFELIHCDVWGPTRTPSMSSYKYYIVFIDDFSRVS